MKKILVLGALTSSFLFANETKPLGPMESGDGIVFEKGKLRSIIKNVNFSKDSLYNENNLVDNLNSQSMAVNKSVAVVRYGLGNDFEIKTIIPYISKEKETNMNKLENIGLGDIIVEGKYQIKSPKKKDNYFLGLTFGASLPSGSTDKDFSGKKAEDTMPLQLGKGSINPIVALNFTKFYKNSYRLDGGIKYTYNTLSVYDYQFGQEINYDLSFGKSLNEHFAYVIELNGRFEDEDKKGGQVVKNTKSNVVYLTPGLQYKINNNFDLGGSIAIPVYKNYNGHMLGEDIKLFFRLAYTI